VSLSEKARRRPEWTEGVPVTLCDGQTWHFRKPRVRWRPVKQSDGMMKTKARSAELGPEADELLGVIFADVDSPRFTFSDARFEMLSRLLLANYDLTDEDFAELVYLREDGDEAHREMWRELSALVAGQGSPKPTPAT
jgi:hypothetical protein